MQVFSSDNSAAGVYWMFYSGASFETHVAPAGLTGLQAGAETEGLRYELFGHSIDTLSSKVHSRPHLYVLGKERHF